VANVILIDGNSLSNRAIFALPTHQGAATGQVTNPV
jgi:hypothetical protein